MFCITPSPKSKRRHKRGGCLAASTRWIRHPSSLTDRFQLAVGGRSSNTPLRSTRPASGAHCTDDFGWVSTHLHQSTTESHTAPNTEAVCDLVCDLRIPDSSNSRRQHLEFAIQTDKKHVSYAAHELGRSEDRGLLRKRPQDSRGKPVHAAFPFHDAPPPTSPIPPPQAGRRAIKG